MPQTSIDAASLVGAKVKRANSSLRNFAIELEDGRGISIEAVEDEGEPLITANIIQAESLPSLNEAVCSVDWSWIYANQIKQILVSSKMVRFQLHNVGPLNVSVGTWQGSPFLSFQPFRPNK